MLEQQLLLLSQPLIELFKRKAYEEFPQRTISLFKFGSLGEHGDFSLCSDVDVVLMLDRINDDDASKINVFWDELKQSGLNYCELLSLFWSSYDNEDFSNGRGRFPALDRLDFIYHAKLIAGEDYRDKLLKPSHQELILESAQFILDYMLTGDKFSELLNSSSNILQKGARYFTKFVLFPVRLIFTLDHPDEVTSNKGAVEYFNQAVYPSLPPVVQQLVNFAYTARANDPDKAVILDLQILQQGLIPLYQYCIKRYYEKACQLNNLELAEQLKDKMKSLANGKC